VTKLPYANLQAFRILREAYYSQLEIKGDKNDPEVIYFADSR
jgi:vacuolar protein sorting-associated protein 72